MVVILSIRLQMGSLRLSASAARSGNSFCPLQQKCGDVKWDCKDWSECGWFQIASSIQCSLKLTQGELNLTVPQVA
jgi:hypothetical protein